MVANLVIVNFHEFVLLQIWVSYKVVISHKAISDNWSLYLNFIKELLWKLILGAWKS